jgi:DNA-binding CsgD family transcriptional regulator/PAS domain-containing protein
MRSARKLLRSARHQDSVIAGRDMPRVEDLFRLLQTLYSAPSEQPLWERFLKELVEVLEIPAAGILYQDLQHARHGYSVSVGVDPTMMATYAQYYGKFDPFRPRFLSKGEGEIALGDELCPAAELQPTEFYADLIVKYDTTLFGVVATAKQPQLIEHISLYRSCKGDPPPSSSLQLFRLFVPHLRAALRTRQELRDLTQQLSDSQAALHALSVGIILLDARGKSVFVNRAAEAILGVGDGLRLCGGCLAARSHVELARLQGLISAAIQTACGRALYAGGSCLISRRSGGPLRLSVQPLPPPSALSEAGVRRAAVLVLLRASDSAPAPPELMLRTYYGLSPAEARLALQLYEGHSLSSTAQINEVSIGTVRMQLKAVFRKTGVGRQIELQRLLHALSGQ